MTSLVSKGSQRFLGQYDADHTYDVYSDTVEDYSIWFIRAKSPSNHSKSTLVSVHLSCSLPNFLSALSLASCCQVCVLIYSCMYTSLVQACILSVMISRWATRWPVRFACLHLLMRVSVCICVYLYIHVCKCVSHAFLVILVCRS